MASALTHVIDLTVDDDKDKLGDLDVAIAVSNAHVNIHLLHRRESASSSFFQSKILRVS